MLFYICVVIYVHKRMYTTKIPTSNFLNIIRNSRWYNLSVYGHLFDHTKPQPALEAHIKKYKIAKIFLAKGHNFIIEKWSIFYYIFVYRIYVQMYIVYTYIIIYTYLYTIIVEVNFCAPSTV